MTDRSTACCRACEKEFTFDPAQRTFPTPTGTTVVPPRLCPECEAARHEEDERLLAAARTDRSLAHAADIPVFDAVRSVGPGRSFPGSLPEGAVSGAKRR